MFKLFFISVKKKSFNLYYNTFQLKQEKYRHKLEQLKRLLVRENILLDNQLSRKLKFQNSVRKLSKFLT